MRVEQAVKKAIEAVNRIMADVEADELTTYRAFAEEFDAMIEGWEMRIQELENEEEAE